MPAVKLSELDYTKLKCKVCGTKGRVIFINRTGSGTSFSAYACAECKNFIKKQSTGDKLYQKEMEPTEAEVFEGVQDE